MGAQGGGGGGGGGGFWGGGGTGSEAGARRLAGEELHKNVVNAEELVSDAQEVGF
jgi:hypothetical protein